MILLKHFRSLSNSPQLTADPILSTSTKKIFFLGNESLGFKAPNLLLPGDTLYWSAEW